MFSKRIINTTHNSTHWDYETDNKQSNPSWSTKESLFQFLKKQWFTPQAWYSWPITKDLILILDPQSQDKIMKHLQWKIKPDICVFKWWEMQAIKCYINQNRIVESTITWDPFKDTYRLYSYQNGKLHIIKNPRTDKCFFQFNVGNNSTKLPKKQYYMNRIMLDEEKKMRYGPMVRQRLVTDGHKENEKSQ